MISQLPFARIVLPSMVAKEPCVTSIPAAALFSIVESVIETTALRRDSTPLPGPLSHRPSITTRRAPSIVI